MLNHVVLMKFKSGVEESDVAELEKMLDNLPNKIRTIDLTLDNYLKFLYFL